MTQPTDLDLAEVLNDALVSLDLLRDTLPTIITVAQELPGWPDTLLTHVIEGVTECIGRLDAAASILTATD